MKKLFYIKDSIENKISYYHLLFFMLALPFDRFYSTIILVSLLIHTVIFFRKERLQHIGRTTFILQSVFIVTIFSLTYAAFVSRGVDVATKQLAIFLFPLLFAVTSLDIVKYRNHLLLAFVLCCTITVVYLFLDAIHVIWYDKLPLKSLFSPAFVNHNFSLPIDMHATYLSMLLAISFIWSLQQVFTGSAKNKQLLFITCPVILLAGLIQLGSKSVLVSLVLIMNVGFPWFVLKKENRYRFLLISLPFFALLVIFILSVDVYRDRYMVMLKHDLHENAGIAEKTGRIDRWNTAMDLIKHAPLAGTGSGSEIPLLREMYFDRKMYAAYLDSLNAHNQYLGLLINTGIIGLLIYLGTLGWGLIKSIKKRDVLLLAFIILVTVVSFSEDLLDVNKGIFFYAFFFSFFIMPQNKADLKYIFHERQPARQFDEL